MCMLCVADDLEDSEMAEPWDELKDGILEALKDGVKSFSGELKDSIQPFLKEQAVAIAREKWRSMNADTPEECEIAESNLRHLKGQCAVEIKRLELAASKEAEALLRKTFEVAIGVLIGAGKKALGL